MLPLENLQRAFAAQLLREDESILRGLIDDDAISSERRMSIYLSNFRGSLLDALADTYPVTSNLVGSDFFQFLFDQYRRLHPARSGDLRDFGGYLPEFLVAFEPTSALPYLVDVARLEWAYHVVFHAPSPAPFEPETLACLAPAAFPNLKFRLGPACRLLHSRYPIFRIWEVNQEGYVGEGHIELDEGPQTVLVVRRRSIVELWQLPHAEAAFVEAIAAGHNLGRAVDETVIRAGDFSLDTILAKYVRTGAFVFKNLGTVTRNCVKSGEESHDRDVPQIDIPPP